MVTDFKALCQQAFLTLKGDDFMVQPLSLCITGFGGASQAFCRLLMQQRHTLLNQKNTDIRITGIAGRSKGSLHNPAGINLVRALEEITSLGAFSRDNPEYTTKNTLQIIEAAQADVLLELTTSPFMTDSLPSGT